MRALLVALAAVLTVGCAAMSTQAFPEYAKINNEEWRTICRTLESEGLTTLRECNEIKRPIVVVTDTVSALEPYGSRLYGFYYSGEVYVFVNSTLTPEQTRETAVHETVHYVLWELYGENMSRCDSEHYARVVHHTFSGTEYDAAWRNWYDCQIGYSAPL